MPASYPKRRIGLFGGSFNPAHEGHREISITALTRLGLDCVWWLVTPGNPLKDKDLYAPIDERLRRARKTANHPDIVISDFESRHNLQYTVDTITRLRELNPDTEFVWIMGADSLQNFHRWRDWKKIAEMVPMAIFNRPGYESDALSGVAATELASARLTESEALALAESNPPAWIFFSDTNNPLSSTDIRDKSRHNIEEMPTAVTDLQAPFGPLAYFLNLHPDLGNFRKDAIAGLSENEKWISPKYFYDERGSKLFNEITQLKEYYPTRTEKSLFLGNAAEISAAIGEGAGIFEYGSGSSEKVEWLVRGIKDAASYVAMDISKDHLIDSASALAECLPVPVAAICADFHAPVEMPSGILPEPSHWLGYFPGSTIGNMLPETARAFLTRASTTLGQGAEFLLGVDLEKDKSVVEAAYNDERGVTAAFNLNLLHRMKNELDAELTLDDFEHYAFYNETMHRIEMHLRARKATQIRIDDQLFQFSAGETLHTENSHKFSIDRVKALIAETPWRLRHVWTDEREWYAACLLSNN